MPRHLAARHPSLELDPHPDATTPDEFRAWCIERKSGGARLALDLFCGGGGLSLGLQAAGWTLAAAVDHDKRSVQTHAHNFGGLSLNLDLSLPAGRAELVSLFDGVQVDLVAGGPPCQPFSHAGSSKIRSLVTSGIRAERDERRELWQAFIDIVDQLNPRTVLMENVPNMALGDDMSALRTIVNHLDTTGYDTSARIVDTWRYGVPQHRQRLIILARRDQQAIVWPEPVAVHTVRDAIGDLPALSDGTGTRALPYQLPTDPSDLLLRLREGSDPDLVNDHITRSVRPDDREAFSLMTPKSLYGDLPERLRRYDATKFKDKYKRLGWDSLSRTITAHIAKDGYGFIHPSEHRTLSVREAARIQTFPDHFRFAGSRSDAFRQVGNAVPPLMAEAVSGALIPSTPVPRPAEVTLRRNPDQSGRSRLHAALEDHAQHLEQGPAWFTVPAADMTNLVAVVVALLTAARTPLDAVAACVSAMARSSGLGPETYAELIAASPNLEPVLTRLATIVGRGLEACTPESLAEACNLNDTETSILRLLLGDDVLVRTNPVLRVATRLTGAAGPETGAPARMNLAAVVGGGRLAPRRMTALLNIATTSCGAQPRCDQCPLINLCPTAAVPGSTTRKQESPPATAVAGRTGRTD